MDKKKILGIILGLLVLAGLIWSAVSYNNSRNSQSGADTNNASQATAPATALSGNSGYDAALLKYGTNVIEFQQNCQASPTAIVVKTGTTVMLGNRASAAQTVKADKTYTIPSIGFVTTTVSSSLIPNTITVGCGSSENVASIIIVK